MTAVLDLLIKCKFLIELDKDGDASTAGPVGISSVGYVNPMYSAPMKSFGKKKKKTKYIK